jgi:peroxiredoxin
LEIPNVQNLAKANIVQVIGIANDKKEALRKFIEENGLTYPNAIATDDILNSYGITGFPTTYLISPDRKIITKNLRGENLVEQVQLKIDSWKKSKQ